MAITNDEEVDSIEIGSSLAEEQHRPSSSLDDLSLQEEQQTVEIEEGLEIGQEHLIPVAYIPVAKSMDNDDTATEVESIPHSKMDDDDSAAAVLASSSTRKRRSPCKSRHNKLFLILVSIAVLAVIALSAGFFGSAGKRRSNSESSSSEVTSAMMAATEGENEGAQQADANGDEPTIPPSTSWPTTSPTLPVAGIIVSNDFDNVDNDDDSNRQHGGWIRRR